MKQARSVFRWFLLLPFALPVAGVLVCGVGVWLSGTLDFQTIRYAAAAGWFLGCALVAIAGGIALMEWWEDYG